MLFMTNYINVSVNVDAEKIRLSIFTRYEVVILLHVVVIVNHKSLQIVKVDT